MKTVKLNVDAPNIDCGTAVALGFFDGLHIGHAEVIRRTVKYARENNLAAVIWTFESMPKHSILLTDECEKSELAASLGCDYIIFESFEDICTYSGEKFVREILIEKLHTEFAFSGFNFTFGAGGKCGVDDLRRLLRIYGSDSAAVEKVECDGETVSSTLIRRKLELGDVKKAADMLGRPYHICGKVTEGKKLGRDMGFPTANLVLDRPRILPKGGVYISRVTLPNREEKWGITNIGTNPTVSGDDSIKIETHILDYRGDLYSESLKIEFMDFIRSEKRFGNLDELISQLADDEKKARSFIEKRIQSE